ncbi:peptidyl-prolyl cis-trans isomerase sig-7 [Planococcus citri]|uniref:peptidyl-prolyl cis-trans isomerase sig-7 n=1 Tax=Planococcus citri TaxID=170843 RepID=UPI0031F9C692
MAIVLETTVGDMTIDLFTNERPITCKNFLKLCKSKYYHFCLFHSIQSNFIAQTGDPTGTGSGGESIFMHLKGEQGKYFSGEKLPRMKHDRAGLVSMVNCGDNLVGSQFFITLAPDLYSLDEHVIFGEITEGLEVLLKLNEAVCDHENRPYQDIRITHTVILEDPYDDIPGICYPDYSPEPTAEILQTDRLAADEEIFDDANISMAEVEEMKAEQEAEARATILEIVGDIPDKDIAPPENVLFVCKLNPLTTDEDLEMIFRRFGTIVSCEVIRDKESGDSLQYAFIEFDNKKSCEDAYLKMDNVLIDDRRIHVDFSQSVAKMRWRGKGRGIDYFDDKKEVNKKYRNEEGVRNRGDRFKRRYSRSPDRSSRNNHGSKTDQEDRRKRRSRSRSQQRYHSKSRHRSRSRDHGKKSKYRYRSNDKREEKRRSDKHARHRDRR